MIFFNQLVNDHRGMQVVKAASSTLLWLKLA